MIPDRLASPIAVIDAHVHVYDTRRLGSVAIPPTHAIYRPVLPAELRTIAEPLGVRGAVAIEVSPNPDENQWLLDLAATDPFLVAVIGNLNAGTPGFAERLAHYSRNPRFRGIRVGTPWCPLDVKNRQLLGDLETLASSGLTLDAVALGGGNLALLRALIELGRLLPELRIVITHLPFDLPDDPAARADYRRLLRVLADRPRTYAKVSKVLPRTGAISRDPADYAPLLDELVALFGPDRLMYGSNWPTSSAVAPYERALAVLLDYFMARDTVLFEKFMCTNAQTIYGIPADAASPMADTV